MPISSKAEQLHAESAVIDMHVHPALKTYLFDKKINERHSSPKIWWPLTLRTDLPKLREGGVDAILSSLYLPEKKILDDCIWSRVVTWFSQKLGDTLKGNRFDETMKLLDEFESLVGNSQIDEKEIARIAHSRNEMDQILAEGKIAILHSIEGAHSLDGNINNVQKFFDKGVCLITLGHFYENEVVSTVDAIPDSYKKLGCFKMLHPDHGLSAFGNNVTEKMVELGILIDLTHSTRTARNAVYAVNNNRRPLVFSHVGVSEFYPHEMNPSDKEIEIIAKSKGIIGVIFFNHWLNGETDRKNGLDLILKTIQHIEKIGGIETVAIGTDFDGFTDPPDDVKDPSEMPKLTETLVETGFSDDEIKKILGGNAKRVLQEGWGK